MLTVMLTLLMSRLSFLLVCNRQHDLLMGTCRGWAAWKCSVAGPGSGSKQPVFLFPPSDIWIAPCFVWCRLFPLEYNHGCR